MKPKGLTERARSSVINSLVIAECLELVMLNPCTDSGCGAPWRGLAGAWVPRRCWGACRPWWDAARPGPAHGADGRERSPVPLIRAARAQGRQPVGGGSGVEASLSSGFREQDPQEDVRRLSQENKTPN